MEEDQEFACELWRSIFRQTEWLSRHLETHLLGNHLFENGTALAFVQNTEGSGHRIIGKNLSNPATPLLRYDTGDLVEFCGEHDGSLPGGRVVCRIDGRQEDYIDLRNGARLGRMDHVFKDMTRSREAQLYQEEVGVIVVRVVRQGDYTMKDEERLLREFRKRVGEDTKITIEYHDTLPRTKRGKLRFVVSDISKDLADSRRQDKG